MHIVDCYLEKDWHELIFFMVKGSGIEGAWIKDPSMPVGCAKIFLTE